MYIYFAILRVNKYTGKLQAYRLSYISCRIKYRAAILMENRKNIARYHNAVLITSCARGGNKTPSHVKLDPLPLRDTTRQLEMYQRKEIAQLLKRSQVIVCVLK